VPRVKDAEVFEQAAAAKLIRDGKRCEMIRLLVVVLALGMTAVYRPNSIIPEYYVDKAPRGEYRVYDSKQIVLPKYIVKPDPAQGKDTRFIPQESLFCLFTSSREEKVSSGYAKRQANKVEAQPNRAHTSEMGKGGRRWQRIYWK